MKINIINIFFIVSILSLTGCFSPPDIEMDINKYSSEISQWKSSGLINHFPISLPIFAKNIKLSSFQGYLQGGAWIQVRMELPEDKVKELYEYASKRAKQYHNGGGYLSLTDKRKDGLGSANFHTSDNKETEFSMDYRIFIFGARAYKIVEKEYNWNHGTSKGMVISLEKNEVIFYAETW